MPETCITDQAFAWLKIAADPGATASKLAELAAASTAAQAELDRLGLERDAQDKAIAELVEGNAQCDRRIAEHGIGIKALAVDRAKLARDKELFAESTAKTLAELDARDAEATRRLEQAGIREAEAKREATIARIRTDIYMALIGAVN